MIKLLTGLLALAIAAGAQAQASDTLKKIRDSKTITLGYRTDSPPFSFAQDGQPVGYSVDLCKRVVTAVERSVNISPLAVKWVPLSAANRFDQVSKGAIDIECGNTSATLSRMERFDFSNLIFVDAGALLVLQETQVGRLSDVGGKTVGVVAGTTTEQNLKSALKERLVEAKIVSLKDEAEALSALQAKQIDAYAGDRVKLVGLIAVARTDVKYRLVQDDFTFEPYALMMRRDPAFRLVVNRALSQIYRSGAVTEIYDRWLARLGKPGPLLIAMYYLNAIPE
jgi:glutamate/aspartate transport system substrate-binding protein